MRITWEGITMRSIKLQRENSRYLKLSTVFARVCLELRLFDDEAKTNFYT